MGIEIAALSSIINGLPEIPDKFKKKYFDSSGRRVLDGLRKVLYGLGKVWDCLGKVLDVFGMVFDCLGKVLDGFRGVL